MEHFNKERSDYAQGTRTKSAEGRVLRPRKRISISSSRSERVDYSSSPARRSFDDSRNSFNSERGSNRGRRAFSPSRSEGRANYAETRGFNSERRTFNSERTTFSPERAERRGFGSASGERRPFNADLSERRGFGGGQSGERRSFEGGERRGFGGGERRSYNSGRSFSNNRGGFNRGSSGGSKFGRKPFRNNNAAEEGINQMLSKSEINLAKYSDNDTIMPAIKDEIRLNKFIANSGKCSRREADTLIEAGVVTVNGVVVTALGTKINIKTDEVKFNGEKLRGEEKVYIVMNKPKGYVTTTSDPHVDKTVFDLFRGGCPTRIFPVGRLDKNTTGVLMFTNDGEMAERLTHPSYDKKKIYQVTLDMSLQQEDHDKIMAGIELHDGMIAADELEYIDARDRRKLGIKIHSGKNRIVRRLFEALGYEVKALDRVYFAGLTKKGLSKGEWRYLSEGEINILKIGAYI